jgi:6,7-dimethyl-8-ribityllumazine synthase
MKKRICIVLANYYPSISKNLLNGAATILKKNKIFTYKKIVAPGVFEIPIIISKNLSKYDAFISLGCVIKGQTPHFSFISKSSIDAIMNLSVKSKKPIGNGILTCLNYKQALLRSNPKKKDKGGEAAKAMISVLKL